MKIYWLREKGLYLRILGLAVLLFGAASSFAAESGSARPPNIVFILADDLGWRDLSVYGSRFYETPNLDRLAREGMRFTQAYAACPVCSPSRASLLTGKYPATVGITDYIPGGAKGKLLPAPFKQQLPLELPNYARLLHDRGNYVTWHVGKWHLGSREYWPEKQGFDVNVAGCDWGMPAHGYFSPYMIPNFPDDPKRKGEYLTDRLTDEAIALIKQKKADGRPFLLNFWTYAVHIPIQAPRPLVAKYTAKAHELGLDKAVVKIADGPMPYDGAGSTRIVRRMIQSDPVYAAMIENLDTNVGRLLRAVDETGQTNNTLIIFSSDNGGLATAEGSPTSNIPLWDGKGWLYEGGIREPFIIKWPGVVAANSTCSVPVTSPDVLPTLLEATHIAAPPDLQFDGVSLMPLLRGGHRLDRDAIFWHYPHYGNQGGTPCSAIRSGDWKLIEFFEDGRLELYNLQDDVSEHHDLAKNNTEQVNRLHNMLIAWRKKVGALLPEKNPNHKVQND